MKTLLLKSLVEEANEIIFASTKEDLLSFYNSNSVVIRFAIPHLTYNKFYSFRKINDSHKIVSTDVSKVLILDKSLREKTMSLFSDKTFYNKIILSSYQLWERISTEFLSSDSLNLFQEKHGILIDSDKNISLLKSDLGVRRYNLMVKRLLANEFINRNN